MAKIIKINVGGTYFTTTKTTLIMSNFFSRLFDFKGSDEHDKEIFIDRDPKAFKHVLNTLRDSNYVFPEKYKYELEYYGVDISDTDYNKYNDLLHEYNLMINENDKLKEENNKLKEKLNKSNSLLIGGTVLDARIVNI
jgi:hypothetical protein